MKAQASLQSTVTSLSSKPSSTWCHIAIAVLVCLLLLAACSNLLAQENFLVATADGTFSLYDLSSLSLLKSFQSGPYTYTMAAGADPRLVYSAGGSGWGMPIDTTIGHDIVRFKGVIGTASTIGANGKYYLVADYKILLDVVDTTTLQTVKTVDYSSLIPKASFPGAIVAANNRAYIFPRGQSAFQAAVVDLSTFQLSALPLPPGSYCRRCASRTPDGSTIVLIERENSDGQMHIVLIDTATNTVVHDFPQALDFAPNAFLITRSTNPNNLYGYAAIAGGSVVAVDLRPNSQTYGQYLAGSSVTLPNLESIPDMAISSDGSRLIAVGVSSIQPPAPNVEVIDTAKMLSDPAHALIAQLTANGGIVADTVCTGFFPTTPPPSAPTVTGVSGDITNDKDNGITITGTNFQPGALVRIGNAPPLPANVMGSTTLSVTVPAGAPAGKAQDIVVTNPLTNMPPDQQNQSGLLAGKFNILPKPVFQPTTQFATGSAAVYVYDPKQKSMVNPFAASGDGTNGLVFNQDGKYLYLLALQSYSGIFYAQSLDLSTNALGNPILLSSDANIGASHPLVAARDPQKNTPVVYVSWDDSDLHLGKIDSDPSSPTFNTIVQTFNGGLDSGPDVEALTVTPDSKYAYEWYNDGSSSLGILNLSTGAFTSISAQALGINISQFENQVSVTPDGKSLLLANFENGRTSIKVFDISNPIAPEAIARVTPMPIHRQGVSAINYYPAVNNYQVVGSKLYGVDLTGVVVVFNFNPNNSDFRQRGYAASNQLQNYFDFGFSADGSYLYLADFFSDLVLVVDANKVETSINPTVTNIRSPYSPGLLAVSPVPPPGSEKKAGGPLQ